MRITLHAVTLGTVDFQNELDEMAADWYLFGCALGLEPKVLDKIKANKNWMDCYMRAMLQTWLDTNEATWEVLQTALTQLGNRRLAKDLEVHKRKEQG